MTKNEIRELVQKLTTEEKISLTTGGSTWETKEISRLGIPALWMSDGPHGLRKGVTGDDNDDKNTVKSVSFPAECMMAASFDRDLLFRLGEELGDECQGENVQLLLGPGINMKRNPLCGRNFEYMSEDPYLAGELGSAYVNGIQSRGVGACVKHFFANNQETRRFTSSSDASERALREIYLTAFEKVIKQAKPWAVMASYNKINGVQGTENKKYLTDVLRKEWGYEGCVISDWGATHNRGEVVKAGCALTMPQEQITNVILKNALENGQVTMEELDVACEQVLTMVYRGEENRKKDAVADYEHGHDVVRRVAVESAVLLKNEENLLPLSKETSIAMIGDFAKNPRYQGGGSSHVSVTKLCNAFDEATSVIGKQPLFAKGYEESGETTAELILNACKVAYKADVAIVFAGLTDAIESEGYDRRNMKMPAGHVALIEAVAKVNPNILVVLHNGSPVEMPWIDDVKAVMEMYLPGEAGGEALVDLLYGEVCPSGRLPETFPLVLEDNPSFLEGFGTEEHVRYLEDIYIGYRYYETKKMPVRFPFGFGLSYTEFAYSDLQVAVENASTIDGELTMKADDRVSVKVKVKNTGKVSGAEVVQLYVGVKDNYGIPRPVRELKNFEKVFLTPGEEKEVSFLLSKRDFSYWNEDADRFHMGAGLFEIQIGKNASEILLAREIRVLEEELPLRHIITDDDYVSLIAKTPEGAKFIARYREALEEAISEKSKTDEWLRETDGTPISLEKYMNQTKIWAVKFLTYQVPFAKWNIIQDICNGHYTWEGEL